MLIWNVETLEGLLSTEDNYGARVLLLREMVIKISINNKFKINN